MIKKMMLLFCIIQYSFSADLTKEYINQLAKDSDQNIQALKKKIGERTIVFIPGILSETVIESSSQLINISFLMGDYFLDQLDWCKKNDIKCVRPILESEASVDENSERLKKILEKVAGEIIVVSHSKGSLEFLNILIKDKAIRERTHAWIAMQSPFFGAVATKIFLDNSVLKKSVGWIFSFLGGSAGGVESISIDDRMRYQKAHRLEIDKLLKSKRILHYGSYIEDVNGVETILELTRDYIKKERGQNDGLVELSSTKLAIGDYINEEGVDHLMPVLNLRRLRKITPFVIDNKNWSINRAIMLKSLLFMVLK